MSKSILEKTNSWKPFVDAVQGALKAKDFRKSTVRSILKIADPDLSMWPGSTVKYCLGLLVGPGFVSGREAMFTKPFEEFLLRKGALFENAPLRVIKLFNQLVLALFSPQNASSFHIDESLARRRMTEEEKVIKKGGKAQARLTELIKNHARSVPHGAVEAREQKATQEEGQRTRPLFSPSSPLDLDTRKNIEELAAPSELTFDRSSTKKFEKPIQIIERAVRAFRTVAEETTSKLSLSPLNKFKNISEEALPLSKYSLGKPFLADLIEKESKVIEKELDDFFAPKKEALTSLLDRAQKFNQSIEHVREEKEKLAARLSPFLTKKDFKGQVEIILSELNLLAIPDDLFSEKPDILDKKLHEKLRLLQTISEKIEKEFHALLIEVRELERSADFHKMFFFAARWEIIANSVPYPDLQKVIPEVRNSLCTRQQQQREALIGGTISLAEFMETLTTALYESDIRLIRGELTSRSLRLKDLRDAISAELLEVDRWLSLLHLAGGKDTVLSNERQWLSELFYKLLNPFSLFKEGYNPDSIHLLFRYWWNDLDKFRARKKRLYTRFLHAIEGSAKCLIRPIAQALDLIEKEGRAKGKSLYERFINATKNESLRGLMEAIIQWITTEDLSLITHLLIPLASLPFSELRTHVEKITKIEKRIDELTLFAQEVQRIRTFEPERLTSLLEIISVFPFLHTIKSNIAPSLSDHLQKVECALDTLEREVLSELGLLDKKARIEAGSALPALISHAGCLLPNILQTLKDQLRALGAPSDPFLSPVSEMLIKRASFLFKAFPNSSSDEESYFSYFQKVAVFLFSCKALKAAQNPKSFARILLTIPIIQNIIQNTDTVLKEEQLFSLETIGRNIWNDISVDLNQKIRLHKNLCSFIQEASSIFKGTSLKQSLEGHLIRSLQEMSNQLEKNSFFETPCLSFTPGDLWFFWKT